VFTISERFQVAIDLEIPAWLFDSFDTTAIEHPADITEILTDLQNHEEARVLFNRRSTCYVAKVQRLITIFMGESEAVDFVLFSATYKAKQGFNQVPHVGTKSVLIIPFCHRGTPDILSRLSGTNIFLSWTKNNSAFVMGKSFAFVITKNFKKRITCKKIKYFVIRHFNK